MSNGSDTRASFFGVFWRQTIKFKKDLAFWVSRRLIEKYKEMRQARRFVFVAFMLFIAVPAWAYDFEVGGIYYNITNGVSPFEVGVTNNTYSSAPSYSGDVIIPEFVVNEEVIYSVTSIGNKAFANCSELTSVTIPNSVTTIDGSAFNGCIGLVSIDIPNSVTSIGDWAFYGCTGVTSLTIPQSVISIGSFVFISCSSLEHIIVDDENQYYDSRESCNAIIKTSTNTLLTGCKTTMIPNSVTTIGSNSFAGCSGMTSLVTIPNSVTTIEASAFDGCSGLTSISIPSFVTYIGPSVFRNCSNLEQIVVDAGNQYYDSRDGCNAIIETSSNTLVAGCKNTMIPNSVTTIGRSAFDGCSGLFSVTIPNSVTTIGVNAFAWCTSLVSIIIPDSVTSIEESAFYSCTSLTSVVIPNSVTTIKSQTFQICKSLTSVTIPYSVTSIGNDAFSWCRSLTCINIPSAVTSIGRNSFYKCFGLTSVVIPCSVTFIGEKAFFDCRFLNEVIIEAINPPVCGNAPFPNYIPIYVPCGSKEAYANAEVWKDYADIFGLETQINLTVRSSDEALGSAHISQRPDCESHIATVFAEPIGDHSFMSWTVNGHVVSTANPYTFMVEGDMELVANFYGTGVDEETEQKVTLSPNPTKNHVNIECDNMKGVTLCTLEGRIARTYESDGETFTMDMTSLPHGIYILRIETKEGVVVNKKIIKE